MPLQRVIGRGVSGLLTSTVIRKVSTAGGRVECRDKNLSKGNLSRYSQRFVCLPPRSAGIWGTTPAPV